MKPPTTSVLTAGVPAVPLRLIANTTTIIQFLHCLPHTTARTKEREEMCLIKFRPNHEEDNIVPNRPLHTGSRSGVQSEHQPTTTTNIAPTPEAGVEAKRGGGGVDMPHEGGLNVHKREEDPAFVIIEQQGHLYDGEVVTTAGVDGRKVTVANEMKYSSRGGQGPKRSGSVLRGRSPRQSNASFRTTRERIVVVDERGRKREYYQRDDSGR